ncbi:MAG: ABC transporter ATP-binding protein [Candidatus Liptonbacteria bacterium]|nr:ABC transporter ATP-binding protein [Candidatus Liptonbacteria bacterium]
MIEVKNLKKLYGKRAVVNDLSLTVGKGSVFGFLGQNGAGKTTTIKMMTGISKPDAGTITIGGKDSSDISMRENIGFMPEAPYFYDRLTGLEFLEFCGSLFAKHKTENEYLGVLRDLGIYEARNRAINTYSKGMKQRLGFAQVLVNDPGYIFLDEPLDGLDPLGRRGIKKIITELKARGKTVFFNSHILYDTEEICDEIGVIHEGKLLYSGPVKEFCNGWPLEKRFVEMVESRSRSTRIRVNPLLKT